MQVRTGEFLRSRKTGREDVKVAVVRTEQVMLHDTTNDRRWWTPRTNLSKSFISTR